jgi:putative ABC transport system permease protein
VPLASTGTSMQLAVDGRSPAPGETSPSVSVISASDGYFEALPLRPVAGRLLTRTDGEPGREGVVVNQRLASTFLGDGHLGRRIQLTASGPGAAPTPWLTVVGVVPTLPQFGPDALAPTPIAYVLTPLGAMANRPITILARGQPAASTASLIARLRDAIRALDVDLPLYSVQTFSDVIGHTRFSVRLIGSTFWLLAIIAVVLATVGLYALTAYGVAQRTQEIGVRLALGAATTGIVWLFVRATLIQLAIGLTLGLAGALATGQLLQSWLTRVAAHDPIP